MQTPVNLVTFKFILGIGLSPEGSGVLLSPAPQLISRWLTVNPTFLRLICSHKLFLLRHAAE